MSTDGDVAPSPADDALLLRLFVAIPLPAALQTALAATQRKLARTRAHVAWIPPTNIHLSLVFLGDTPRDQLDALAESLRGPAAGCAAFDFTVRGVGTFGRPGSPRVIWAGVDAPAALRSLQANIQRAIAACGCTLDARPYTPHITLGRVRSGREKDALAAALRDCAGAVFGAARAERVILFRSLLRPTGAVYSELATAPLAAAPTDGSGPA